MCCVFVLLCLCPWGFPMPSSVDCIDKRQSQVSSCVCAVYVLSGVSGLLCNVLLSGSIMANIAFRRAFVCVFCAVYVFVDAW